MLAPDVPVPASAKPETPTPVTFSLNTTVHWTTVAFVGDPPARLTDETVGGVTSFVTVTELLAPLIDVQLRPTATPL